MITSGAPIHLGDSLEDLLQFALLIVRVVPQVVRDPVTNQPLNLRVGIHSGEAVGGVLGSMMPRYTFSGDTINTAARMQQLAAPKSVLLSGVTAAMVMRKFGSEANFTAVIKSNRDGMDLGVVLNVGGFPLWLVSRGLQEVKGKGLCQTFTFQAKLDKLDESRESSFLPPSPPLGEKGRHASPSLATIASVQFSGETAEIRLEKALAVPERELLMLLVSNGLFPLLSSVGGPNLYSNWREQEQGLQSEPPEADAPPPPLSPNRQRRPLSHSLSPAGREPSKFLNKVMAGARLRPASERVVHSDDDDQGREQRQPRSLSPRPLGSLDSVACFMQSTGPEVLDGMDVLIAEDSASRSTSITRMFKALYPTLSVTVVGSIEALREELQNSGFSYDLVMLNLSIEEHGDGAAALKSLKSNFPTQVSGIEMTSRHRRIKWSTPVLYSHHPHPLPPHPPPPPLPPSPFYPFGEKKMRRIIAIVFAEDGTENELAALSASADAFMTIPFPQGALLQSRIVQLALAKARRRFLRWAQGRGFGGAEAETHAQLQANSLASETNLAKVLAATAARGDVNAWHAGVAAGSGYGYGYGSCGELFDDDGLLLLGEDMLFAPLLSMAADTGSGSGSGSGSVPFAPANSEDSENDESEVEGGGDVSQAQAQGQGRSSLTSSSSGGARPMPAPALLANTPLRLVVVEDSNAQRKLLVRRLIQCSPLWTVVGVQDGTECIRYLRANAFAVDVLLVDMHLGAAMTGSDMHLGAAMTGSDLTRELRATYGLTRPLIIGLNRDRAGTENQFVKNGGDAAWSKPLPPANIINARLVTLIHARAMLSSLQES